MQTKCQMDQTSFQFEFDSRNIGKQTGIIMKPKPQNQYDGFLDVSLISGQEPDTENLFKMPQMKSRVYQKEQKMETSRYMDVQKPSENLQNQECWTYFKEKRSVDSVKQLLQNKSSAYKKEQDFMKERARKKDKEKQSPWEYFASKEKSEKNIQKYMSMQEQGLHQRQPPNQPFIEKFSPKEAEQQKYNLLNLKFTQKPQMMRQTNPSVTKKNPVKKHKKREGTMIKNKQKILRRLNQRQTSKLRKPIKTSVNQIMNRKQKCHSTLFYKMVFNPQLQQELAQQSLESEIRYPRRHRVQRLEGWKGERATYFEGKLIGVIRRDQQRVKMDQQL